MTAASKIEAPTLLKLREPFPAHQISKLPKRNKNGSTIYLDYVGHAALTDRLLDTDPHWSWEPVAFTPEGLPAFDRNNGLWIKLTVLGVTRLGYGSADGKQGGDAIKEIIGDALRNAAMRFGAALDLWHKGDLHAEDDGEAPGHSNSEVSPEPPKKREKLDGPYTSATALQTAIKQFVREMEGVGDWDTWVCLRDEKETAALIDQIRRDMPNWWLGSDDMPEEFIPLSRRIEMLEYNLANKIADHATV